MEVGAELRKEASPKWVRLMERTMVFLRAVLMEAHSTTFNTGMKCVQAIGTGKKVAKLRIWRS